MGLAIIYAIVLLIIAASGLFGLLVFAGIIAMLIVHVPFVPTPAKNVSRVIDQFHLNPGDIFYDIGCGDGRFLIEAEKRGAIVRGFEIAPWAYLRARCNVWLHHSRAQVRYQNFYAADISDATAVFCFLIDTVMPKVEQQLQQQLQPGARVASYGFPFPHWQPSRVEPMNPTNPKSSKLYVYVKH